MIPTPQELGLPPKFREFRSHQADALERIAQAKEKVVLIQAPTGSGKTLIMAALQRHLKTSFLYTCHTKQLQAQVVEDYPYAVEVKGRGNYPCLKSPTLLTANECTREKDRAQGGDCPHVGGCPYLVQKALARSAELAILNVPYFLG